MQIAETVFKTAGWCKFHASKQVRFFRDCLRIACSRQPQQPGTNHRFQDWSRTSIQLTEFLWNQVRPNLPSKKKQRVKEGTVLVLGDRPVAEQHRQILKLGPKFCFEPALKRVDKLALSRLVSRQVPEEDKPSGLRALVSDKEGFFVIMPEDMFAEKATCAVQKNFKAVLEKPAKVKERAVELLERLNLKQVGRLEDAGFPESVIASAAEAIVKSIKVKRKINPSTRPAMHNQSSQIPAAALIVYMPFAPRTPSSIYGDVYEGVEDWINQYERDAGPNESVPSFIESLMRLSACADPQAKDDKKQRVLMRAMRDDIFAGLVHNPA
ncbi:hypothetical protein HPB47_012883 [Ixodes persulcatus]|uniref:Uncharacterized protein n=1 Tax=Ixodes persulcatus TaxID=34615 RepID=A0AC60NS85_IXOPE|nr:hypothetical protein HPB47_012883 [Ixodes persulcatus]